MTPDLPYPYSINTQSGGSVMRATVIVFTVALGVLAYLAYVPAWSVAVPAVLLGLRVFLYSLIRNATHEAFRMADADAHLDGIVEDQIARAKSVGLTPGFLNEQLLERA